MAYRSFCSVLEEMRVAYKHYNFTHFAALMEELQTIGNRMEAGLSAKKGVDYYIRKSTEAKMEYRKVVEEVNKLRVEKGEPPHDEECFW